MAGFKRWHRVVRHWSIREADWVYAVYRYTQWEDNPLTIFRVATGDEEWAKANAKQIGVEIQDETSIEGQLSDDVTDGGSLTRWDSSTSDD